MKALLKSKTFWTGIASIITGVGTIIGGESQAGIQLIATGLVAIFLRQAVTK